MGIEPTARFWRAAGFEDQGDHQTSIASSAALNARPARPLHRAEKDELLVQMMSIPAIPVCIVPISAACVKPVARR